MKVCAKNCRSYYLDDIIKSEDLGFDNILIDGRSPENVLIYYILFKTLVGPKPLCIRFDKVDGFIRIYDGTSYLTLFVTEKYNAIYNRIRYLVSLKRNITYVFFLTITRKSKLIPMILCL